MITTDAGYVVQVFHAQLYLHCHDISFVVVFRIKYILHFLPQTAELRDQIVSVHEEKKTLAIELENLRCKLAEVIEEVCIVPWKARPC